METGAGEYPTMIETPQAAYDRGMVAGKVDARLADHDNHFASINGTLAEINNALNTLNLSVQRVGDKATNRDSMWTKLFAVLAAISTAISIIISLKGWGT